MSSNNNSEITQQKDQVKQYSDIIDSNNTKPSKNNPIKTTLGKREAPTSKPKIDINGVIATNWSFGSKAFSNDEYVFKTLQVNIPDPETGESLPGYTIGQYIVKPKLSTMWLRYNKDALYYADFGDPWFLIGKAGSAIETGYWLCVPENTDHKIINMSPVSELRINLVFPGAIIVK